MKEFIKDFIEDTAGPFLVLLPCAYIVLFVVFTLVIFGGARENREDCTTFSKMNYFFPAGIVGCWLAQDICYKGSPDAKCN